MSVIPRRVLEVVFFSRSDSSQTIPKDIKMFIIRIMKKNINSIENSSRMVYLPKVSNAKGK